MYASPSPSALLDSIDEYDTILIGYPIWWHTAPMIIGTSLESYDLSNVMISLSHSQLPWIQSSSTIPVEFVRDNAGSANVNDGLFAEPSDTETIDGYLFR